MSLADKSILIIEAGMGGLAAGVYGQLNNYRTQIFERHAYGYTGLCAGRWTTSTASWACPPKR